MSTWTRPATRRTNSRTSRVLPMPASPTTTSLPGELRCAIASSSRPRAGRARSRDRRGARRSVARTARQRNRSEATRSVARLVRNNVDRRRHEGECGGPSQHVPDTAREADARERRRCRRHAFDDHPGTTPAGSSLAHVGRGAERSQRVVVVGREDRTGLRPLPRGAAHDCRRAADDHAIVRQRRCEPSARSSSRRSSTTSTATRR